MNSKNFINAFPVLAFLMPMLTSAVCMVVCPEHAAQFAHTATPACHFETWGQFILGLPVSPFPWLVLIATMIWYWAPMFETAVILMLMTHLSSAFGLTFMSVFN